MPRSMQEDLQLAEELPRMAGDGAGPPLRDQNFARLAGRITFNHAIEDVPNGATDADRFVNADSRRKCRVALK